MSNNDASTWQELLTWFSADEQSRAFQAYWAGLQNNPDRKKGFTQIRKEFAREVNFRPQSIDRLKPDQRAALLLPYFRILEPEEWNGLFIAHFCNAEPDLLCRFLSLLEIEHDEKGMAAQEIGKFKKKKIQTATTALLKDYDDARVFRYFSTLLLIDEELWAPLRPHTASILKRINGPLPTQSSVSTTDESVSDEIEVLTSDEFTTLDRVLIEKIVETAAQAEGSLTPVQLADLLHTVVSLSTARKRNFYHYGLMDVLVGDTSETISRSEINDERKAWYLAGKLAGLCRQRKDNEFLENLSTHLNVFRAAVNSPGGAGAAIGRNLFEYLIQLERISEAVDVVRGQMYEIGPDFGQIVLLNIRRYLQLNDVSSAQALVNASRSALTGRYESFGAMFEENLRRRHGQCLQRLANFKGAREAFEDLLESSTQIHKSDIYTDLGLVKSGFKALADAVLPAGKDAKSNVLSALNKGRGDFQKAIKTDPEGAVNANYLLSLLSYLESCHDNSETTQKKCLEHLQRAVTGMRNSNASHIYEEIGILGQALFMQSVLYMELLEGDAAQRAFSAWSKISESAGTFPHDDLKRLLIAAETMEEVGKSSRVLELAESIFNFHKGSIDELFLTETILHKSESIRNSYREIAENDTVSSEVRWKVWSYLVPAYINLGDCDSATQGLDQMDTLSMKSHIAPLMLEWLKDPSNYDPAWEETDSLWTQIRIARMLGENEVCAALIVKVFHNIRDRYSDEARDLLEQAENWRLDVDTKGLANSLPDEAETTVDEDEIASSLISGTAVKIIFVGGNETQQKYDEKVRNRITTEWPGVEIDFHHTGWSSNWGRLLDSLVKECNQSDVVVMSPYMRTNLGRRLRESITSPWVACTGTGRESITRSVIRAAKLAIERASA